MKKLLLAACLLIAAASGVQAQPAYAYGTPDCGRWVKSPNPNDQSWLLGYLSGMNGVWVMNQPDALILMKSADQAFLYMDNYCKANPLSNAAIGAQALFAELVKQPRQKK